MNFVSPGATIAELAERAAECERQAQIETEPLASEFREKARFYRGWIAQLRSGRWFTVEG